MEFGTGCVKMTPAHDPNDFEVGQRHDLRDHPRASTTTARSTKTAARYAGHGPLRMPQGRAWPTWRRRAISSRSSPTSHNVGTCYRCHNDVEPHDLRPVVRQDGARWPRKPSDVVKDGTIQFVPERFTKTYLNWMENVHDWCISRQLWWGHQHPRLVPAPTAATSPSTAEDPDLLRSCGSTNITSRTRTCWIPGSPPPCGPSPRSAGRTRRPDLDYFYPDLRAGHRLRHHLLLGRPDDLLRHGAHGADALPARSSSTAWSATTRAARCPSPWATASTRWR